MAQQLDVRSWRHPGGIVLTVGGDLDLASSPRFSEAIDEALREQPAALVLDLTGVTFLGSPGLSVLVSAHGRDGTRLRVVVATDGVIRRPLEMTGLDTVLPLYDTIDAAFDAS